jgi:antitoxin (DNA-binding transcriptional repressor) of toxin-antitoxin stability system
MSLYVDLHQNDLSLTLLRQYLQAGEDVIITDIKQFVARITPFVEKSNESKLGKIPLTEVEAVCGLYQANH